MTRAVALLALLTACAGTPSPASRSTPMTGEFADDVAFLRAHSEGTIVLARGDARVAISPAYQGRVMTSSARGDAGTSCGWIHRALIASGERAPHMNAFGGEDRFWLGPEGGQYGLYFAPGVPFDLAHWQVPEAIDWGAWDVASQDESSVSFRRDMQLVNASGTSFSIRVDRTVRLLDDAIGTPDLSVVAYESINEITNTGDAAWNEATGLVSIWILSMYPPSPRATVVIPFHADASGPIVNDAYFGAVPADRLRVDEGVLYFRADGQRRSKIGVPSGRAVDTLGSWDPDRQVLTIVRATIPAAPAPYVNSMWETQSAPYAGDVVNSYCDGPVGPGQPPLGPFYELESSSPAAALAPGAVMQHTQTTMHLQGPRASLDAIARARFGVGLDAIEHALSAPQK